jgi:hypothetical protein
MCHAYSDINGHNYDTKISIIAGYENYADRCMKHIDVISLFKELGNAIQLLLYKTKTGNVIYNDEFYSLTSKIMEYIFGFGIGFPYSIITFSIFKLFNATTFGYVPLGILVSLIFYALISSLIYFVYSKISNKFKK